MAKRLLIVGAGGLGREIHSWAEDIVDFGNDWYLGGFLDEDKNALQSFDVDLPILGSPDKYQPTNRDVFTCAIGDPKSRLRVSRSLRDRGAQFVDLIHPSAVIGKRVRFGTGFVACPQVCVTCDVTLGDFVLLNVSASVGHDAVLGDGCTLSGHCDVTGNAQLGEGVTMGSHSCVLPGVKVGDYARIGGGSVVLRKVPAYTTVLGIPAKKLVTTEAA